MNVDDNRSRVLYFDESGYTGSDLCNHDQPYFTLASVLMSQDELKLIENDIDLRGWGKELHFKKMYDNPQGRNMLIRIFHHELIDKNHVKLAFGDKRFCIYAQMVDMLIEPYYYYGFGGDLYDGANQLFIANALFSFARCHEKQDLVRDLEQQFVRMVRNPVPYECNCFCNVVDKLRFDDKTLCEFGCLLSMVSQSVSSVGETVIPKNPFNLDLTIPLFSESIQRWYAETGIKYDVLFDNSKPFLAGLNFLEALKRIGGGETKVGYGKYKHIYPLPAGELRMVDSRENFGVQVADLCASALCFLVTPGNAKYGPFKSTLMQMPIFQAIEISISCSSWEYIQSRMGETGGINPVEYICRYVGEMC